MRLRFKPCRSDGASSNNFSILVDDNCDWQQLHAAILLSQPQLNAPILSLNKKDYLTASAGDKVKSLGICSGDLIWVMVQDNRQHAETQDKRDASGHLDSRQLQSIDWPSPNGQADASSSASMTETPESLLSMVHQALLDGGLQHLKEVAAGDQPGDLTAEQQAYAIPRTSADGTRIHGQACCKVRYIRLGSSVVVWAATASMGMRSICLTPSGITSSLLQGCQGERRRAEAPSQSIHDELLLPVMQALCQEEGLSPPSSLRMLPLEIRMLILQSLPARQLALLACTCKDFNRLASAEELWERQFRREFSDVRAQPQEVSRVGWKGLFAAAWRERSEGRRHWQSIRAPPSRLPWPGGAGCCASRSPALAGIAGGDIDRLPQPFLNIPRPYGRTFASRHFQML